MSRVNDVTCHVFMTTRHVFMMTCHGLAPRVYDMSLYNNESRVYDDVTGDHLPSLSWHLAPLGATIGAIPSGHHIILRYVIYTLHTCHPAIGAGGKGPQGLVATKGIGHTGRVHWGKGCGHKVTETIKL